MAMMTLLDIGILRLRPTDPASNAASGWDSFVVMGGCALIEGGGITIYAENAETRASLGDESGKKGSLLIDAFDEVATAKNAVSNGDVFMATKSVKRAEARIKLWDEPTFQGN
jgi:F0F1-type ATP synthase epsilon subunit